jgi:hypothetical protein
MFMSSEISGVGPGQVPILPGDFAQAPNLFDRLFVSTISPSDKHAIASQLGASVPELEMMIRQGESKAIDALLNAWLKNIDEQADRIRMELTSPRFRLWLDSQSLEFRQQVERDSPRAILLGIHQTPEYSVWIQSLPAADRLEELSFERSEALRSQLTDGITGHLKNTDDIPFMTAGFVIAAGLVVETMMVDVASTSMVGANPISNSAIALSPLAPNDLLSSLNLAINFFAMGMVYHTVGEALAKGNNQPVKEGDFAKKYAEGVLEKVKGNDVDGFMKALVVNAFVHGEPVSDERAMQLATVAKMGMVMVALAVLYDQSAGWLNPEEISSLINGKMESRSKLESDLVKTLLSLRNQLPQELSGEFEQAFISFIATRPSSEVLMNPLKAANGIFAHVNNPVIGG